MCCQLSQLAWRQLVPSCRDVPVGCPNTSCQILPQKVECVRNESSGLFAACVLEKPARHQLAPWPYDHDQFANVHPQTSKVEVAKPSLGIHSWSTVGSAWFTIVPFKIYPYPLDVPLQRKITSGGMWHIEVPTSTLPWSTYTVHRLGLLARQWLLWTINWP